MNNTEITLLDKIKEKYSDANKYGDNGVIFTNNNGIVVVVHNGRNVHKDAKWYFGVLAHDKTKIVEVIQTGCYSYTKSPYLIEDKYLLDPEIENYYPLYLAENQDPKYWWMPEGFIHFTSIDDYNNMVKIIIENNYTINKD
jgi:hypothetical protein